MRCILAMRCLFLSTDYEGALGLPAEAQQTNVQAKQTDVSKIQNPNPTAANGIWKQEILFHEKEIEVYGLNHPVLLSLFLNESVLRNRMRCVTVYSFLHLSFQEFFAALFYALEDNEQTEELGTPGKDIKKVLEKYSEYDTNWILVVRFLFGLLNEETSEYLIERTGCKISPRVKEDLLKWIQIGQGTTPVLVE